MDKHQEFRNEVTNNIQNQGQDASLNKQSINWIKDSAKYNYSYNFSWFDRPIIQLPQDILAMQELIWKIRPDLIIETGIAHGGSLIFSASMLAMLDYCDASEHGAQLNPKESKRKVLGVDIDIRGHNSEAIAQHPLAHLIEMIEGSSIAEQTIAQVKNIAGNYKNILVCLDSNHTHQHVLEELKAYAELASLNSYCVVFDTIIDDMPDNMFPDRPWGKENNPKTAVHEFLQSNDNFIIDDAIDKKLLITVAPDGYLKRVK